jgi:hypothetical protein
LFNKFIILLELTLVLNLLSACSTKLKLPAQTQQMETVYLLKYSTWGHHSLAFYKTGILTEFTYGDWELFALNKRDWWTGWKNMTFLTQGALGRKSTPWNPGEPLCGKFKDCEIAVPFSAPADKVSALLSRLQNAYENNAATAVYNELEEVYFVKYAVSYWIFHNCNHELADWLEMIDVEVTGKLFYKPDFIAGMEPKPEPIN